MFRDITLCHLDSTQVPLGNRGAQSGGGGNCTRVPRSIRQGVYVCVPLFDFGRKASNWQDAYSLIQSYFLTRAATGG